MTDPAIAVIETEATRLERFVRLRDALEAEGPDCSVPGASKLGQWAIVTENEGKPFINRADTREDCATVAAETLRPEEGPVCIYDLDVLAGDEPPIAEGDIVSYAHEDVPYNYRVVRVEDDHEGGEMFLWLYLVEVGGVLDSRDDLGWDDYDHKVDQFRVDFVESDEPDDRMPVRYTVAAVKVVVAFNTVASP